MNILVCVKQVLQLEGFIFNEADLSNSNPGAFHRFSLNRFDEFALEQAVLISEAFEGVHIDVITAGPQRSAQVLKRALGMGCHEGIHLLTSEGVDPDQASVAAWIAEFAAERHYRLILCGTMSEDFMCGQVGPMLAAHLRLPHATQVIAMEILHERGFVRIEREIEGGVREAVEMDLPALLSLQPGINRPRYPSLSNMLRANKKVFPTIPTGSLLPSGTLVTPMAFRLPAHTRPSRFLNGSPSGKADQLAAILKEKNFI